jgi:hypothetical protein
MKFLLSILLAAFLPLGVLGTDSAFTVIHRVTWETQAKLGLEFTLNTDAKDGVVWVKLEVPRKRKFATLAQIQINVKDAGGKELLVVPVAASDEKGVTHAHFRLANEQARRCTIILETEAATERDLAANYLIELKGYLESKGVASLALPPEPGLDIKSASAPPKDGWAKLKGRVVWYSPVPQLLPLHPPRVGRTGGPGDDYQEYRSDRS